MHAGRDFWYHELAANVSAECPPEEMGAEDPLFILYTSDSTGTPKGVVHSSGGYLVYAWAAFSLRRCLEAPSSSQVRQPYPSSAFSPPSSMLTAIYLRMRPQAVWSCSMLGRDRPYRLWRS